MLRSAGKPARPSPVAVRPADPQARWDAAAARLLESLLAGGPADLDPELERFLRGFVRARAQRWNRQLGVRALGVDPEDVVQRVLLQLLECPPHGETTGRPLRRLVAWVTVVSRNHLLDVTTRCSERLARGGSGESTWSGPEADLWAEEPGAGDRPSESRFAARQALRRLRPAVAQEYPAGLPLLDLLLDFPQATSRELARRLQTSPANVDQMRCRIRRVLRRHLEEPPSRPRRKT